MNDNLSVIKQQAALWLVRQNQESFVQQDEILHWMNQSPLHQQTYYKLQRQWQALGQISTLQNSSLLAKKRHSLMARIAFRKSSLAAVAAIFCLAISLLSLQEDSSPAYYQTAIAQQQTFILTDGSEVTLNASSKISVDINLNHRAITIINGDAHFEVIGDTARPFVVTYQDHSFTALGTAFTVNTRPFVQLNVTEHQVKIHYQASSKIVDEGYQSEFVNQWLPSMPNVSNSDWRAAKLTFNNRRLADVLAQLQPYLSEKIYLMNTSLADESVSGSINLHQPYQALSFITLGMGLKLKVKNNLIKIM